MRKATATYRAPFGDSKVVEMGGVTFFDGKPVDLNSYEHAVLISNLEQNQYFDVEIGKEDNEPATSAKKRGRPSNADKAMAKEAADKADADAKAAAEKAKEAKADLDAINKLDDEPKPVLKPEPVTAQASALPQQTGVQANPLPPQTGVNALNPA
jgi:hypothetical protein